MCDYICVISLICALAQTRAEQASASAAVIRKQAAGRRASVAAVLSDNWARAQEASAVLESAAPSAEVAKAVAIGTNGTKQYLFSKPEVHAAALA